MASEKVRKNFLGIIDVIEKDDFYIFTEKKKNKQASPHDTVVKNPPAIAEDTRDMGLIPG